MSRFKLTTTLVSYVEAESEEDACKKFETGEARPDHDTTFAREVKDDNSHNAEAAIDAIREHQQVREQCGVVTSVFNRRDKDAPVKCIVITGTGILGVTIVRHFEQVAGSLRS